MAQPYNIGNLGQKLTVDLAGNVVSLSTTVNATSFTISTSTIANNLGVYAGIVNATTHSAGANVVFTNASLIFTGNTSTSPSITLANTGNFVIGNGSTTQTTSTIVVANSTGNVQITPGTTSILATGIINAFSYTSGATFTANATLVNAAAINITGQVNTATFYATSSANIASVVQANATGVWTTGTVNAASHTVGTGFVANLTVLNTNTDIALTVNNKQLRFATVNALANSYFINQNDDNFVFYTTNTNYQPRAVFSIYANSITSNLNFAVRTHFAGGLSIPTGQTLLDSTGSQGTVGQVLTSNGVGNVYWSTVSGGGSPGATYVQNTDSRVLSGNLNFTGTNVYFTTAAFIGAVTIANLSGIYTTGTVNAASHTAGTSTVANNLGFYTGPTGTGTGGLNATATTVFVGNNTVNTVLTNSLLTISNSTTNASLSPMSLRIKGNDVLRHDYLNYSINNIALGILALGSVTTADKNTALGREALYSLDTGNNNIAIGYQSGFGLATGSAYNVAIGYNTLINGAFGILGNICVGHNSLNLTLGNYSTAIGYQALANTSDGYHVGVGTNVLLDVSTGTYNTAVGANTGRGITTGSYNTIIGSQVTGLAAALANTIIIADGAGVKRITANSTSSYIVANTLTVGTGTYFVSNGNVGIGTSTPGAKLVITPSTAGTAGTQTLNKIRLFDDGANNVYGFGISAGSMDITSSGTVKIGFNSLTTNTVTNFAQFQSGQLSLTGTDGTSALLITGATKGVRTFSNSTATSIEGVDNTGVGSYQPLYLGGSQVSVTISNVEKFKVDSSGNVTMPSQPMCTVVHTPTVTTYISGAPFQFTATGGYDPRSMFSVSAGTYYRITVPVAGRYMVHATLLRDAGAANYLDVYLKKNGTSIYRGYSYSAYDTAVISVIVNCAASDYFDLINSTVTTAVYGAASDLGVGGQWTVYLIG